MSKKYVTKSEDILLFKLPTKLITGLDAAPYYKSLGFTANGTKGEFWKAPKEGYKLSYSFATYHWILFCPEGKKLGRFEGVEKGFKLP